MNRALAILLLTLSLAACGPAAALATPTSIPPTETPTPTPAPTEAPLAAGLTVSVPQGPVPTVDGTLAPGEWDSAYEAVLSDGSGTLFLMHSGGYLYVGIRGNAGGVGIVTNILVDQGESVAILHSSAALGTATYQKDDERFHLEEDFTWRARMVSDSPRAEEERQEFFEQEGWFASITPRGATEDTEYQIEMPEGWLRLAAIVIGPPSYDQVVWWPASLDDDCLHFVELFQEYSPEEIHFAPETWALVIAE